MSLSGGIFWIANQWSRASHYPLLWAVPPLGCRRSWLTRRERVSKQHSSPILCFSPCFHFPAWPSLSNGSWWGMQANKLFLPTTCFRSVSDHSNKETDWNIYLLEAWLGWAISNDHTDGAKQGLRFWPDEAFFAHGLWEQNWPTQYHMLITGTVRTGSRLPDHAVFLLRAGCLEGPSSTFWMHTWPLPDSRLSTRLPSVFWGNQWMFQLYTAMESLRNVLDESYYLFMVNY